MTADAEACASLRFYKLFFTRIYQAGMLLSHLSVAGVSVGPVQMWGEGAGGTHPIFYLFFFLKWYPPSSPSGKDTGPFEPYLLSYHLSFLAWCLKTIWALSSYVMQYHSSGNCP